MKHPPRGPTRRSAGFGLVELLLAVALGLVLVAGLLGLAVGHLTEQRAVSSRARLSQDLRASLDLALRDARRGGWWGQAELGVWDGDDRPPSRNPYGGLLPEVDASTGLGSGTWLAHRYSRDSRENQAADANEHFGLRLNRSTLEWRVSGAALASNAGDQWQALTDPNQVQVSALTVSQRAIQIDLLAECGLASCPDPGDTNCPPRLVIRHVDLRLQGQDLRDSTAQRQLRGAVRLRNEEIQGACPTP
jgi:type IV pilus assembly protein PilW